MSRRAYPVVEAPATPPAPGRAARLRRPAVAMVVLGVIAFTLVAGGAALVGTPAGTRWLLAQTRGFGLEVRHTHGTLLSGLRLDDVRWQSGGTIVTAKTLRWRLRPAGLARGRVDLGTVRADRVAVSLRSAPQAAPEPFVWPRLHTPLPVTLHALALRAVSIERDGKPLLRHGELHASARLRGSTLTLAVDRLEADALDLRGTLHLGFDARGAVTGALHWEYAASRPFAGELELDGALADALTVRQRLTVPAPATLRAAIATPLAPGEWSAELELAPTALAGFGAPEPWRGRAALHASGSGPGGRISGDFALTGTPAGAVEGDLKAHGAGSAWTLDALHLAGPDAARVDLSGRLDLATGPAGKVQARWQALRWPLDGAGVVHAKTGELTLDGTAQDWRFALDTALQGPHGGPGTLRAQGRGDAGGVQVEALHARALNGNVDGTAKLSWAGAPAWAYDLAARGLDPGHLYPDWPGAVDLVAQGEGRRTDAGIDQRIRLEKLGGRLRGQTLAGSGRVQLTGALFRAQDLKLRFGNARVAADGALADGLRLRARVPQLAGLVPDASGTLAADLTVSGTPAALGVRGTATAGAVRWANWRVGAVRAQVDLAPGAPDRLVLDVLVRDLTGALALDTLRVQAGPRASAHTLTLDADAPNWKASARARGGIGAGNAWRGTLRTATWQAPGGHAWVLQDPAALAVSPQAQTLGQACLAGAGARACLAGENGKDGYSASAQVSALPLATFAALLPPDLTAAGMLNAQGSVRGAPGVAPQGSLALTLGAGTLRLARPHEEALSFAHGGMRLDARFDAAGTDARAGVIQPSGSGELLTAQLRAPAPLALDDPAGPLAGRVVLRDLSVVPLAALSPDVTDLAGTLSADLEIAGRVGAPAVRGQARLRGARARLPALGIDVREVGLTATAQADQTVRVDGQARSGKGELRLAGQVALDAAGGFPLQLDITGTDFLAADTTQARVLVSPKLSVRSARRRVRVRGEVEIPEAMLRPAGATRSARASPDVVVVGREVVPAQSPLNVDAEVTVRLGKKVRLAYAGLTTKLASAVEVPGYALAARLGGQLTVREQPGEITRASGSINIEEGEFSAYGQRLDITAGRLRFADQALDNPGVSLEAQRKVGDVTAGVRVRGRLQSPTLAVFSDPAMAQEEALSYLILGRPLRGASQEEGSMLARAAGVLGVSGGDRLAKRIGARLGLDELGVGNADGGSGVQGAALQAGKYLSPRLYVGYGLGLFDQVGAFKVRFDLTERWVLEATSGLGQAMDLLYTRER